VVFNQGHKPRGAGVAGTAVLPVVLAGTVFLKSGKTATKKGTKSQALLIA
jgi:hypothetical protein